MFTFPLAAVPTLVTALTTLLSDMPALAAHWSGKGSTAKALAIVQDAAGVGVDVVAHLTPDMLGAAHDIAGAPTAHQACCAVAGVDPVTGKPVDASSSTAASSPPIPAGFDYDKFAAAMIRARG